MFVSDNMQPNLHKNVDLKIEQIWNHNIGIILLIIFGGIITFGLLSCIILFINGLSFGIVMANLSHHMILHREVFQILQHHRLLSASNQFF